jgi:hypothetical protein
MASRWFAVAVMAGVLPAAIGCYSYTPLETSSGISAGEHIAVEITDRGRAALGDRIGAGVVRLEGTVTSTDSQNVVMNVWRVAQIGGVSSKWSGESVQFSRDFMATVESRNLNRGRTYLVAGGVAVGLVLVIKSASLFGDFFGGTDPLPDPPPTSNRGWPF